MDAERGDLGRAKHSCSLPTMSNLIGYKTRELALASHHMPHAHTNNGIFFPVIAEDGIICGNWSPWKKTLQADYFDEENKQLDLEKQWERFLEMKG